MGAEPCFFLFEYGRGCLARTFAYPAEGYTPFLLCAGLLLSDQGKEQG